MYNINSDQGPHLLLTTFFNVPLLLILSQSQNVAWLSVKEFEDLIYFFFQSQGQIGLLLWMVTYSIHLHRQIMILSFSVQ